MTKAVLKTKLQKAIDELEDEAMLEALYNVVYAHLHSNEEELSDEEKKILDERIARHDAGQEKGYTWAEVKRKIRSKKRIG